MAASLHVSQPDQPSRPDPTWNQLVYAYHPSKDGIDENLLILLHGFGTVQNIHNQHLMIPILGDSHVPFTKLGRSLSLPQTATLAIRGPELQVFNVFIVFYIRLIASL
jgi:predicted esterase